MLYFYLFLINLSYVILKQMGIVENIMKQHNKKPQMVIFNHSDYNYYRNLSTNAREYNNKNPGIPKMPTTKPLTIFNPTKISKPFSIKFKPYIAPKPIQPLSRTNNTFLTGFISIENNIIIKHKTNIHIIN